MREYIIQESIQQYKDYYESDREELAFFEYLDNITNRDKIRFGEIFEDFTIDKQDYKDYMMIKKREYNPELSVFSNFVLDLQDFKDRVRPMARDIALIDVARKYQKYSMKDIEEQNEVQKKAYKKMLGKTADEDSLEEGYSSKEIEEKQQQQ